MQRRKSTALNIANTLDAIREKQVYSSSFRHSWRDIFRSHISVIGANIGRGNAVGGICPCVGGVTKTKLVDIFGRIPFPNPEATNNSRMPTEIKPQLRFSCTKFSAYI